MLSTLRHIMGLIEGGGQHIVVTADASMIVDAHHDSELRNIIQNADLVTPDGMGLLWAAKKQGKPLPAKVSGVELVGEVCALSAEYGYRVFLLGSEPGVAEQAAERLRLLHPGCNIVGARHGYFPQESDELVARGIGELQPDILFVAMGIPRQEKFITTMSQFHLAKVGIGVGGSFDVYSGRAKRAPKWMQRAKLEWFWRLMQNPSKWRKTMKLPIFARMVMFGR